MHGCCATSHSILCPVVFQVPGLPVEPSVLGHGGGGTAGHHPAGWSRLCAGGEGNGGTAQGLQGSIHSRNMAAAGSTAVGWLQCQSHTWFVKTCANMFTSSQGSWQSADGVLEILVLPAAAEKPSRLYAAVHTCVAGHRLPPCCAAAWRRLWACCC
jgi:hypothetical protein